MRKLTSTELQHVYGGNNNPCRPKSRSVSYASHSKCASYKSMSKSYSKSCQPPPCRY